jgi:hypothetical protein
MDYVVDILQALLYIMLHHDDIDESVVVGGGLSEM